MLMCENKGHFLQNLLFVNPLRKKYLDWESIAIVQLSMK
jgi:hypothetical protein